MDEMQAFLADTVFMFCFGSCKDPQKPGAKKGRLDPCPSSPNCVSSFEQDKKHYVAPIAYTSSLERACAKLAATLEHLPDARIVSRTDTYIHAECRSFFFRFVDDVEFLFPENEKIIHVWSASRVGYSDFGANRKRVEKIRYLFCQSPAGEE